MNTTSTPHAAAPDLRGWLEREGWTIEQPCPCTPASTTPPFRAASPCGRLVLDAADPYETGRYIYSLRPASGLGSWVLAMAEEPAPSVLDALRDALDDVAAASEACGTESPRQVPEGLDVLDLALRQVPREVVAIYLHVGECADAAGSGEAEEGR
ncbi:hypothetical protein [Actinospica robiniae]|uniref:hypothetical protein n=1 Tax=Actinospica robiniae TaxID=304901 RepID=UPI00040B3EC1|nr:hypothetical protein [Actinospica robiniae]